MTWDRVEILRGTSVVLDMSLTHMDMLDVLMETFIWLVCFGWDDQVWTYGDGAMDIRLFGTQALWSLYPSWCVMIACV